MMGAGASSTYVLGNAGIEVVLIDAAQEAADRGKAHAEGILDKGMKRGKVTAEKKAEVLGRISATTDYAALAGCDLIVEAVFEDPGVKAEVTKNVLKVWPADCIFAHQTPSYPCPNTRELANASEQARAIHRNPLFSSVDRKLCGSDHQRAPQERANLRSVAKALELTCARSARRPNL